MIVRHVNVKSVISPSRLPEVDYAVNPYVGCPHKCLYCYAEFMKRFTYHVEPWGDFLDVKSFPALKHPEKYANKYLFIGSVTDPYNPYEGTYGVTRLILEQLLGSGAKITLATKSSLILRDIDLLREFPGLRVAISLNTLDEVFRQNMDCAASVEERVETMKQLHEQGIYTVCFISPIFPAITDVFGIINATKGYCDEYWVENLNLRGSYKPKILEYISLTHPAFLPLYEEIYSKGDRSYWTQLATEIDNAAQSMQVLVKNYFYHETIRKN